MISHEKPAPHKGVRVFCHAPPIAMAGSVAFARIGLTLRLIH
jgi:hypothetical protein